MEFATRFAPEAGDPLHTCGEGSRPLSWLARGLSRRTLLADRFLWAPLPSFGPGAELVEIPRRSGGVLRGVLVPGTERGVVLFCPGNSGNLSSHWLYVELARRTGRTVLAIDYTGYGRSAGEVDLRALVEDVVSARVLVRERLADPPCALFGISLGAASALAAAARLDEQDDGVSAIILEGLSDVRGLLHGVFTSGSFGPVRVRELVSPVGRTAPRVRARLSKPWPRWLAPRAAERFARSYPFEGRFPAEVARRVRGLPALIVHGVEDELLPFEAALDVHAALEDDSGAGSAARLWLIPGCGHAQEPALSHGSEYVAQLADFLGTVFGPARSAVVGEVQAPGARLVLASALHGERLAQTFLSSGSDEAGRFCANGATGDSGRRWTIDTFTLAEDGFPRPAADSRSAAYRRDPGGSRSVRDVFRRLVSATNARDFHRLDQELSIYRDLDRVLEFDLLASTYALRLALAARKLVPGWPRPPGDAARRARELFRDLWRTHAGWCDSVAREAEEENAMESPLVWIERELQGGHAG